MIDSEENVVVDLVTQDIVSKMSFGCIIREKNLEVQDTYQSGGHQEALKAGQSTPGLVFHLQGFGLISGDATATVTNRA